MSVYRGNEVQPADIIREKFAQRLTHELAVRNWSQSELARRASVHLPNGKIARDNISNYKKQRALPSPAFLLALAKALDTTPEDLLPERGAPLPRDSGALPSTDVRDAGQGVAFLRINKRVPWPLAVRILEILNEEHKAALAADRDADNG